MFNRVLTTCTLYEASSNEDVIDSSKEEGSIKEYQTVVAVGPLVKCVKPGDVIVFNPARYQVMKHKEGSMKDGIITDNPVIGYNFPILPINNEPHLYIYDSDIDFIIKEWDDENILDDTAEII